MRRLLLLVLFIVVCIGISFAGTHTPWDGTKWDITSPDIDQPYGNDYKEIYDLRKGIAIRMNKEHETLATSSAGGVHKPGSAVAWHLATASIPAKQVDGTTALDSGDNGRMWHDITTDIFYVLDDYSDPTVDGGWVAMGNYLGAIAINTNKFTVARATGNTLVAGTLTVTGESTFNSHINLGAGDDLIGSATSDIAINSTKFTVAGATGNTGVGGTLDVAGNIDPTTYETTNGGFLDEDAMGSDAADKVASQQSIKAYVDGRKDSFAQLTYKESSGTDGTAYGSADTWQKVPLNTEVSDASSIVTMASSVFTLAAGTYDIAATVLMDGVEEFQSRLRNTTDGSTDIVGMFGDHQTADGVTATTSITTSRITITGTKAFEFQVIASLTGYIGSTNGDDTMGDEAEDNVYAIVNIYKIN